MDQKYNENHCIDGGDPIRFSLDYFLIRFLDSLTSPYETSTVSPSVRLSVSQFWIFEKNCFGSKMDRMCPNWPKNGVFVSFLKFKPSDSADFAYLCSFLLSLTTITTELAEKRFLG